MKTLLITGFEPFGGEQINPSWEAVSRLPNQINGYALTKLLISVVFGVAAENVLRAAEELHPDVILCIGQAGGQECHHARACGNQSALRQDSRQRGF